MTEDRIHLVGCGILKREIRFLIRKTQWPVDAFFLDSALHIDFNRLADRLTSALIRHRGKKAVVFYGCCHPLMDRMLAAENRARTRGRNCVDMLLGRALFSAELEKGAFFLFEEWARRWDAVVGRTFGHRMEIMREIIQERHTHLLCLRTPCSGDFTAQARSAGEKAGLPLRWLDVPLDHLEAVLRDALAKEIGDLP